MLEFAALEFAAPFAFLLLAAPPAIHFLAPPLRARGAALRAPEGVRRRILGGAAGGGRRSLGRFAAPAAVWALAVLALAGPRLPAPVEALPMSGRDIVLALDLSGSMVRDDFSLDGRDATRLEALKSVGAAFVRRRGGDRIGLVVFGSEAYMAAAPTFDVEAIAKAVETMVIGVSGRATNISDGLGVALRRLSASDAETKVAILLSDGVNNAGAAAPRDVARLARDLGVRVHTIALGPRDLAIAEPGERGVVDAAALGAVAEISGGEMFRVRTTEDLEAVMTAIDRLEPTARAGLSAAVRRELWVWPALLAGLGALGLGLGGVGGFGRLAGAAPGLRALGVAPSRAARGDGAEGGGP